MSLLLLLLLLWLLLWDSLPLVVSVCIIATEMRCWLSNFLLDAPFYKLYIAVIHSILDPT